MLLGIDKSSLILFCDIQNGWNKGPYILTGVECRYLSNTTLFDGRGISSIYYIRYNYMFRRFGHFQVVHEILSMRLYETYYGLYTVGRVGGEVGTRSRMCHGGWEVWVHGVSTIICMSKLIIVVLQYHIMCVVEIICTYILVYLSYTRTMCNTIQEYWFCSYSYRFINSSCYYILLLQ